MVTVTACDDAMIGCFKYTDTPCSVMSRVRTLTVVSPTEISHNNRRFRRSRFLHCGRSLAERMATVNKIRLTNAQKMLTARPVGWTGPVHAISPRTMPKIRHPYKTKCGPTDNRDSMPLFSIFCPFGVISNACFRNGVSKVLKTARLREKHIATSYTSDQKALRIPRLMVRMAMAEAR